MNNNLKETFNASVAKDLVAKYRTNSEFCYNELLEDILLKIKKNAEGGWYSYKHKGSLPCSIIRVLVGKGFDVFMPPSNFYYPGEDVFYMIEWKNGV